MNPRTKNQAINRAIKCLFIPPFFRRGVRGDASEASALFTLGSAGDGGRALLPNAKKSFRNAVTRAGREIYRITGRGLVAQILILALVTTCGALLVTQFSDRINAGEPVPKLLLYPTADRTVDEILYLTGHSQPDTEHTVEHNGVTVGSTYSNEVGDFAYAVRLVPGENRVSVQTSDKLESRTQVVRYRPLSAMMGATIVAPQLGMTNLVMPIILAEDNPSSSNPVLIEGHADPDVTVNLFANGRRVGTTKTDAAGGFSAKVPLLDGENAVFVTTETDPAAFEQSLISNTVFFTYGSSLRGSCDNSGLGGVITEDTVWTDACSPYEVTSQLIVSSGVTLWVQEGVEVNFTSPLLSGIEINGTLDVQATAVAPAVFRPVEADCDDQSTSPRNDWQGIKVFSGGTATLMHAEIRCAGSGLTFDGGDGMVQNSRFLNNSTGIEMFSSSPTEVITPQIHNDNYFTFNLRAIWVGENSAPNIEVANQIVENIYGLWVFGNNQFSENPVPIVQGNSLYDNFYNYYADNFGNATTVMLDTTGNWWGTTDPDEILSKIYDYSANPEGSPFVDFRGFLDGPDGDPVLMGPTLIGAIEQDLVLTPDEYHVLGSILISSGATLTLSAGTELAVFGSASPLSVGVLRVDGLLEVQGSGTEPVVFRSANVECETEPSSWRDDWSGIEVNAGGVVDLSYAEIRCAFYGVNFNGGNGNVDNSRLRFNRVGIHVAKGSAPLIEGGNEITVNNIGIGVSSASQSSPYPAPVVRGNSIYGNVGYAYTAISTYDASSITLDATENWWGTIDGDEILLEIVDHGHQTDLDLEYPVVDILGFLDGPSGDIALSIYDGDVSPFDYQPGPGNPLEISFALNTPSEASVALGILLETSDETSVFEDSQSLGLGRHTLTWNGEDMSGAIPQDGVYRARLIATLGSDSFTYDPPTPSDEGDVSGDVPSNYDPFRNDFYKIQVSMNSGNLLSMQVSPSGGNTLCDVGEPSDDVFWVFENMLYPPGESWVYWDGRDPDGEILTTTPSVCYTPPAFIRPLAFQIYGAPSIVGLGEVPNIEVKSDPYMIWHSYEQISNIAYRIDMDSYVTVKMLPPGIYDPEYKDPSVIVMLDNELQQAVDGKGESIDHMLTWKGYLDAEPNRIRTEDEGAYTFTIEAESESTGQSTLYRGVLNIRR